jgi:dipeptidase D
MMTILDLDPKIVWKNFYALTRIPRPSKHEELVSQYLYDFGVNLGLETIRDEFGNIIIRKPATAGYENRKTLVLQGHMDMVPQKNADKVHDFLTDPIETRIEGDWVKACGTTLGADNGLGVAMAMAVLESDDIPHGPIEVLVTVDEETGLTGANQLAPNVLKGDMLLNLDSEDEGEFCIGCAGGLDITVDAQYQGEAMLADDVCVSLAFRGFQGGHSGTDINLYRANANKVAARVLYKVLTQTAAKLVYVSGGTLRNAIARECFTYLFVPNAALASVRALVEAEFPSIKNEYALTDPAAEMIFETVAADALPCRAESVPADRALAFVSAVLACPDGVERMSSSVPGLVETSNNMAMFHIVDGKFSIHTLMRSSVDTAKMAMAEKLKAVFELAGCTVNFSGGYSGWAPKPESDIVKLSREVYEKMYGQEPKVLAIHAGLECGIIGSKYPNMEMISYGSTIKSPHSPDERASIASLARTWELVKAILAAIPEK